MLKLLSEDPANYKDAPREGIRRVLEEVTGQPHPRDKPLDTSRIASIRMGTTVRSHCFCPSSLCRCGLYKWACMHACMTSTAIETIGPHVFCK